MIHELFHRIQPELGLMTQTAQNEHLDTVDGRFWLQLEWRALGQALRTSGDARIQALRDALAFRLARRALFANAAENERREEIREGLTPIPGTGTVYFSNYTRRAQWGSLEASKGVLLRADGTRRVPGPVRIDGATITGDGWKVTVAPGWIVRSGPRAGDAQVVREDR